MTINITMQRTLDDDFVSSVLITAFDGSYGACWYWCEHHSTKVKGEDWIAVSIKHEVPSGAVINEMVNAEVVRKGIQKVLDDNDFCAPYIREYIVNAVAESEAGHIDAEAADVIVQAGLFDELVYG